MRNKDHSRSNADTEDGDEEDLDFTPGLQQPCPTICDVWDYNFDQELQRICNLV